MLKKILVFGLFVILVIPSVAVAAEFRTSKNGMVEVGQTETAKNLYLIAQTVNSEAAVSGDLVAFASNLNINGPVENELTAAGSSINIKSDIGTNTRLAGNSINFEGTTGQDLMVAANTITLSKNSQIGGDLALAGSTMEIDGTVLGNAWIYGGSITLNGTINGNVKINKSSSFTLGDNAVINGNLTYSAPGQAKISPNAKVLGAISFTQTKSGRTYFGKTFGFLTLYSLIASFLLLIVLVYVFPKSIHTYLEKSFHKFWANLGWGFVALIILPIALIILMLSVIGLKIAITIGLIYLVSFIIISMITPLFIGTLLIKWVERQGYQANWLVIIVGLVASFVIDLVPVIGPLILFGFFLVALGQLIQNSATYLRAQR
ncbi:MAG: polymer-forming cytoskeletal protein [Patescibacteria group bacterium]|jgi:cytoskeletal protein CcmA (bactofilin family)